MDDLVCLNVGGKIFHTYWSTISQNDGSKLSSLRNEINLDRDEHNNIFLDLNPKYFEIILNYLRERRIPSTYENTFHSNLEPEDVKPFFQSVKQLGLQKVFSLDTPTFKHRSSCIQTKENNSVIVHSGAKHPVGYALSEVDNSGLKTWKLRIESIQNEMFVGVLQADNEPYDDGSYDMEGSHGWLLKVGDENIASAWFNGKKIYNMISNIKNGDNIQVILNCIEGKLSLILSPVKEFHIFTSFARLAPSY